MSWFERWRGVHWDPPWQAGWLFIVLAVALIGFSIYVYRKNEAPLKPPFRAMLVGLRAVALVLLVAIICRPVLSLAVPGGAARGVLVLLDRSESLTLPGRLDPDRREDELARAVTAVDDQLGDSYPLLFREFDVGLGATLDGVPLDPPAGSGTNLTAALDRGVVEGGPEGRPGAIILISDGTQTEGPDPVPLARRLGVPVQSVALGSPEPVPDLAITRVRMNLEAFAGERTPVEAVLRLQGLEGTSVRVQLMDVTDQEVEIASATAEINSEGAEQRVSMSFTPTETGLRFLEVRIPGLPGESTDDNNRRLISVRVREEKTGILVLSGALTWDHTFLRRAVEDDSTLSVAAGFWRAGAFRRNLGSPEIPSLTATGLREIRVVVLDHVTPAQLGARGQEALTGFVRGGGGLLMILGDRDGSVSQWMGSSLDPLIPIRAGGVPGDPISQLRLTPEGRRHALFDPSTPGAPGFDEWANLPPLAVSPDLGGAKANAEALMVSTGPTNHPVLAWARTGQGRVMTVAGGGVWRWAFMSASHGSGGNIMPSWWRRAAHWLAQPGVETQLDIHPEEDVVSRGKTVTFVARVTDESYQPLPDVSVDITILPGTEVDGETRTVTLAGTDGFYRGGVDELAPGRYQYRGVARNGGNSLGTVEGVFAVDSLGIEMERLEADHELMERIAAVSGGRLWNPDSLDGLPEVFGVMAEEEEERVQVALWDHPLLFALFVILVSLEWFLRRRRGLV